MQIKPPPAYRPNDLTRALNAADGGHVVRAFCSALPDAEASVPEWIPYLPAPVNGHITGEDGRSWPWSVEEARQLAASIKRKLPIDVNHSTDRLGTQGYDAPAYGYITSFQVRDDGSTWARAEWNARGLNALKGRDYAFISPFFDAHKTTKRIVRFAGASLLNEPNFETLPALNSRQHESDIMTLEQLLALLGLAATATPHDAERAINALKSERDRALNAAQNPDLTRFTPRTDYDAVLQRANNAEQKLKDHEKATLDKEIDAEIDAALQAGKITPASRDYHRANCSREGGLEAFRSYVQGAPVIVDDAERAANARGGQPSAGALTADERAMCSRMGITEADYLKTRAAK